jgi:hypothetical protein
MHLYLFGKEVLAALLNQQIRGKARTGKVIVEDGMCCLPSKQMGADGSNWGGQLSAARLSSEAEARELSVSLHSSGGRRS